MDTPRTFDESPLKALHHPIDVSTILRKRQSLRKELLKREGLVPTNIAILGGSTTSEVRSMLELFLLDGGIQPRFYESGYNAYHEDVASRNPKLWSFKPDLVFVHTTWHNISQFPDLLESETEVEQRIRAEMSKFEAIWDAVHKELGALVIQNNFDLPSLRPLGNLEASAAYGRVSFVQRLNAEFANYARSHNHVLINDINYVASQVGLGSWFDPKYWYSFHMAVSPAGTVALAQNVASIVKSVYGKTKKCLVLDLDNTLWGGIIGDDGVANLVLGRDHAVGEAYVDFQRYVKGLQRRGVILAVCSKNDPTNAKEGFSHPDSVLKLADFSCFKANWNSKPQNLRELAAELNIGLDSMVFVDDNPAERAFVSQELPEVAVPEVGSQVSRFAEVLEQEKYFELQKLVADDLNRTDFYSSNLQRTAFQSNSADQGEFLASLEMKAEIGPFQPVYLERITQLINKTNQFNLTTRRLTTAEVEEISRSSEYVTLYGRLSDRFGDNGLVSVLVGHVSGTALEVELWLMSCRVFNREMELAMFDTLVEECLQRGIRQIIGIYIPSKKNGLVADLYQKLEFTRDENSTDERQVWTFTLPLEFKNCNRYIDRESSGVKLAMNA